MEVALCAPQLTPEPLRRGTLLPLSQLVEECRSRANMPNHLLESKIYVKLKSNGLMEAEPPELHFGGFELGKVCTKILKLINISSEVMNIHIIPTQTRHFQTSYTKKYRLIPGLAYTLKVRFCPDEWRYFYDCVRVHCRGEENLLIPVHAYPVIDDLHIPPHIDLSAVPIGQSVLHAIPLRCSCPMDFEFQVHVIQPHQAFSIHPLTGVIPANGEVKIYVTFSPLQYETSQVTIQLVISQFNTKPHLCTITGSSAPHLSLSEAARKLHEGESAENKKASAAAQVTWRSKSRHRTTREDGSQSGTKPPVDLCTPAGVAKLLIKDSSKLSSKDLKEAVSSGSTAGLQSRQVKEVLFIRKVQQSVKEEQANLVRWQVHLGNDPVSQLTRRQVAEEREVSLYQYLVKRGDTRREHIFAAGPPTLSSSRVLCEAGQASDEAPSSWFSSIILRRRTSTLTLFQQAARKVVIRRRLIRRLTRLKSDGTRSSPSAETDEEATCDLKISAERVSLFTFPVGSADDLLARTNVTPVAVDPVDVTMTTRTPFFKLQVPQVYKLRGYRPLVTWEAFRSYVPTTLCRPLRSGAPDELLPSSVYDDDEEEEEEGLTFSAPEALLRPAAANPLRIFNPAPGLQIYKPTPKYLESDLEFHLCPLPRYSVAEGDAATHSPQKFLNRKETIAGLMTGKGNSLWKRPLLSGTRRSVDYSTEMLPLTAPPLTGPPDDLEPIKNKACEGVRLTPEMIKAQFLSVEDLVSNSNLSRETTASVGHQRELQTEATFSQMGWTVMARLKQLDGTSPPPAEDRQ